MPVFGDRSTFAFEYEVRHEDSLMGECFCCFWCGGERIGDWERPADLYDTLCDLELTTGRYAFQRENPRFWAMTADEALDTLQWALFEGMDVPDSVRIISQEEQWLRHLIISGSESFSEWRMYLLEGDSDEARILVDGPGKQVHVKEFHCRKGEVDRILLEAVKSLQVLFPLPDRSSLL